MRSKTIRPVIDGWFTLDDEPSLLGGRCERCSTLVFPPSEGPCPNPHCDGEHLVTHRLSNRGQIWSYTDAQYQPPPPYIVGPNPYEPFALAAVELDGDGIVVLGQVTSGTGADQIRVGTPVRVVVEPLYENDDETVVVWKWEPIEHPGGTDE